MQMGDNYSTNTQKGAHYSDDTQTGVNYSANTQTGANYSANMQTGANYSTNMQISVCAKGGTDAEEPVWTSVDSNWTFLLRALTSKVLDLET